MQSGPMVDAPHRTRHATASRLSGETYGALINLSGRRRFTSQRLILYAVLASLGQEDAMSVSRDALAMFRDAHRSLIQGTDELPGVFCPELQDVYFGHAEGDRIIHEFILLAERTLDALEMKRRQAPLLLAELVQSATPMLAVLNRITQVYEELAKRHALQSRKQLRSIMTDIESIARQAHMASLNAQIVAARAGDAGREFSVVASEFSHITREVDGLVKQALGSPAG